MTVWSESVDSLSESFSVNGRIKKDNKLDLGKSYCTSKTMPKNLENELKNAFLIIFYIQPTTEINYSLWDLLKFCM